MNKLLKILPVLLFGCLSASAQTLEEAKVLFQNEQYYEALPAFKKLVIQQPSNPSINYWYGACLCYTNSAPQSVKYLDMAVKRKVEDAAFPLAQAYEKMYRFGTAATYYTAYRNTLIKRKTSTYKVDRYIQHCRMGQNMMLGIEKVCVVDSFCVAKSEFLKAYKLSPDCGKLYMYNEYFQSPLTLNSTVYSTQRGNRIYYGDTIENQKIKIYTKMKAADGWSPRTLLPENINVEGNVNFPFLSDDGVTIYYAADGANSLGKYDIFVTRYNTDNDTYLKPENIGMPFNSPYNDYMLVIDEPNHLGWFASDRYQQDDSVCVYVFIPNATKQIYDSKKYTPNQLIGLAQLSSIKDTWNETNNIDSIKARVAEVINSQQETKAVKYDFTFIVNDTHTYHADADFQSAEALKQFKSLQKMESDYAAANIKLDDLRKQYAEGSTSARQSLSAEIMHLEKQVLQLEIQQQQQTIKVRNIEITQLHKQ